MILKQKQLKAMYHLFATPREVNHLKFSVWYKNKKYGHAIFTGNLVEVSHFLRNNDSKNLEVSALDLLAMQSHEPVAAEQWLDWYHNSALSALPKSSFWEIISKDDIQQSVKSYLLPQFSDVITIGLN